MNRRAFTVEEANALIPELEEVLARIRRRMESLQSHRDQIQILDALWGEKLEEEGTPDHGDFLRHRAAIDRIAAEVGDTIEEEIVARGIRFPQGGLEHGLLDFPTTLDGRPVFLCWRSGEPEVCAWHDVDGGYAGRRPLTAEVAARVGR